MINTMKSSKLLTRTGVLTILGVLTFSSPATADTESKNLFDTSTFESSLPMSTVEMKEEKDGQSYIEHDSEMEQSASTEFESDNELDEGLEENITEESHSDASGGWWQDIDKWISDKLRS